MGIMADEPLMLLAHGADLPTVALSCARHADAILFYDEVDLLSLRHLMAARLREYVRRHCSIYCRWDADTTIDKSNLTAGGWHVEHTASRPAATGGSTNGRPFRYWRWTPAYRPIECDNHYRLIAQMHLPTQIVSRIGYLMLDQLSSRSDATLVRTCRTDNVVTSHGFGGVVEVSVFIANRTYFTDYHQFYDDVIDQLIATPQDIVLAPGNVIRSLAWHCQRRPDASRLCRLLSNTGEALDEADALALRERGWIDGWCDHMRCWDGGAMFITCPYGTYHLYDSVADLRVDGGRLICTDFTNLASPFVNYWNGDYAQITDDYQRCRCGRLFRPFKMGRTRDFSINGVHNTQMGGVLGPCDIYDTIKRVDVKGDLMRLILNRLPSPNQRSEVRKMLPQFMVQFVVED
jgi:hypothetical protein